MSGGTRDATGTYMTVPLIRVSTSDCSRKGWEKLKKLALTGLGAIQ